jgi:hypothetical protein
MNQEAAYRKEVKCTNKEHSACNRNGYQEYLPWGKGDRCVWLTTLPPSRADCHKIWQPQPPGTLRASPGLYRDSITITFTNKDKKCMADI